VKEVIDGQAEAVAIAAAADGAEQAVAKV